VELACRHHRLASHIDELYGTKYNYDDPRFIATIPVVRRHDAEEASLCRSEQVTSLGGSAAFNSRLGALHSNGSWMIGDFANNATSPVAFARLPQGPEGRKSMFNGLVDSIWVGTPHPEEAWQFVKYLASEECANIVGDSGVVFPAQQSGIDRALAAHAAKGADVSAFTIRPRNPTAPSSSPSPTPSWLRQCRASCSARPMPRQG
jgi:multiple sugar transport system substrate-binding protein